MSTLYLPVPLRRHAGGAARLELTGGTVLEVLKAAVESHEALQERVLDAAGNLCEKLHVFVDMNDIRELEGVTTPVPAGSKVWLLPRVGGGKG